MVDVSNREKLEAWLKTQPRHVSALVASRAALRVLPLLGGFQSTSEWPEFRIRREFLLPSLRAMAASRLVVTWPSPDAANFARAYINAAVGNPPHHAAAHASGNGTATDAYRACNSAFVAAYNAAHAHAAASSASGAVTATIAASSGAAAGDDAYAALAWDCNAIEGLRLKADDDEVKVALALRSLAQSPIWGVGETIPAEFVQSWGTLKARLADARDAEGSDEGWHVWIDWYEAALVGRPMSEAELGAYALAPEEEWKAGPASVNARIKARLKEVRGEQDDEREAPSLFIFGWTEDNTITVTEAVGATPTLPFATSANDHADRLSASRMLTEDLIKDLKAQRYQVRDAYRIQAERYAERLPGSLGGSILLADAAARTLRSLFEADVEILPEGFASQLKTVLEHHQGLRPYYPEIATFYADVLSGRLEQPLPLDAIEDINRVVRENSPRLFEPSVPEALSKAAELPVASSTAGPPADLPNAPPSTIRPPADPLGAVDDAKARQVGQAGTLSKLWKAIKAGKEAKEGIEGWGSVIENLRPHFDKVTDWLKSVFVAGGGGPPTTPGISV